MVIGLNSTPTPWSQQRPRVVTSIQQPDSNSRIDLDFLYRRKVATEELPTRARINQIPAKVPRGQSIWESVDLTVFMKMFPGIKMGCGYDYGHVNPSGSRSHALLNRDSHVSDSHLHCDIRMNGIVLEDQIFVDIEMLLE